MGSSKTGSVMTNPSDLEVWIGSFRATNSYLCANENVANVKFKDTICCTLK